MTACRSARCAEPRRRPLRPIGLMLKSFAASTTATTNPSAAMFQLPVAADVEHKDGDPLERREPVANGIRVARVDEDVAYEHRTVAGSRDSRASYGPLPRLEHRRRQRCLRVRCNGKCG